MRQILMEERGPGHWDVYAYGERLFKIRGEIDRPVLIDERTITATQLSFGSVKKCMSHIFSELASTP